MTNATQSTRTVIEHRFVVPCLEPWGGTWDDFSVARAWAEDKAAELGIDTSFADWSRLKVEDDQLVIVITEVRSADPSKQAVTAALDAAYDGISAVSDRVKCDDRSLDTDEYAGMVVDAVKNPRP